MNGRTQGPREQGTDVDESASDIADLWREHGTPPSIRTVCSRAPNSPMQVVKSLQHLAYIGRVAFSPQGYVFIVNAEGQPV